MREKIRPPNSQVSKEIKDFVTLRRIYFVSLHQNACFVPQCFLSRYWKLSHDIQDPEFRHFFHRYFVSYRFKFKMFTSRLLFLCTSVVVNNHWAGNGSQMCFPMNAQVSFRSLAGRIQCCARKSPMLPAIDHHPTREHQQASVRCQTTIFLTHRRELSSSLDEAEWTSVLFRPNAEQTQQSRDTTH